MSNLTDEELAKKLQQEWADEELAKELQKQWDMEQNPQMFPQHKIPSSDPFTQVIDRVCNMVSDPEARRLADKYGLTINQITWEDNARSKNSCWGPCISDMSLQVEDRLLPVIRPPNFEDLTWDVPIEKIPLVVGNHNNTALKTVTLKEYLSDLRRYLHNPSDWPGDKNSLLAPRDTHVVMSAQACFLPIPKNGEAKFNVGIFNYQSSPSNPAVLAIVASSKGTSAQILDNSNGYNGQKLYFNQNGERCSFIGQRLSDFRAEKGEAQKTGPMTQQEKQQNMLLIIQVPLKHRENDVSKKTKLPCAPMMSLNACALPLPRRGSSNVEDAVVKIGKSEGKFREIGGLPIERDERYPVRVTLQYYKATDNGIVNENDMKTIHQQLTEARKFADFIGSLVVGGFTNRPTEPQLSHSVVNPPPWWTDFWLTYKDRFPQYTESQAKAKLFSDNRFVNCTLSQCKEQLLDILENKPSTSEPQWNVL